MALKGALQDKLLSHFGGIDVSLELKGWKDRDKPRVEMVQGHSQLSVGKMFG